MRVNVVCSKWGDRYGPHFVNRLKNMARRILILNMTSIFIVIQMMPKGWMKMLMLYHFQTSIPSILNIGSGLMTLSMAWLDAGTGLKQWSLTLTILQQISRRDALSSLIWT